jgi:N-methylhydantoinase A
VPGPAEFKYTQAGKRENEGAFKTTPCHFETTGEIATPRHNRDTLPTGKKLKGPLVVEDAFSTIILPPEASLTADTDGNLLIDCGGAE